MEIYIKQYLKKDDYIDKTLQFLISGNYQALRHDPNNKFHEKIKSTVNECDSIFGDCGNRKFIRTNPQDLRLYLLMKLHKIGNPNGPGVSFMLLVTILTMGLKSFMLKHFSFQLVVSVDVPIYLPIRTTCFKCELELG